MEISHITDEEIKAILKSAVNTIYRLLWLRDADPVAYNEKLALGRRFTPTGMIRNSRSQRGKGYAQGT